jgi:N,N-dimethylformamidase
MVPLTGYVDRLSARPGDRLSVKVSCDAGETYRASLVRIINGDPNPEGGGVKEEALEAGFAGEYPSRVQPIHSGSYVEIEAGDSISHASSFTVVANIWPTLPGTSEQTVIGWSPADGPCRVWLGLDDRGALSCRVSYDNGEQASVSCERRLRPRRWEQVWLSFDADTSELRIGHGPLGQQAAGAEPFEKAKVVYVPLMPPSGRIGIAACFDTHATAHFNGKLERPRIFGESLKASEIRDIDGAKPASLLADWDFSQEISSVRIVDCGPNRLRGRLVNLPARAMTGSNWAGREMCWRHAPEDYGAIHFHDDDLYDCGWETDFEFEIPAGMKPGIYGIRLRCGDASDTIPFFVCPPKGKQNADICVIIPTFTYMIYANHARPDFGPGWREKAKEWKAYPHNPVDHPEYAHSTYNTHSDGSGICHASIKRPMISMRPGYITFYAEPGSGLRHLQADTHLTHWLETRGYTYDIVTDHQLHEEGAVLLDPYRVVLTVTHPEYHTRETLDALEAYRDNGGRLVYLGGNGFYWKIALHPELDGVCEIRRGEGGIRAWAAEPGEYYNAFDGEYGGLWRRNGRPPQRLVGNGFSAQGTFLGSYYKRTKASYDEHFAWLFRGLEDDEKLGDFGLCGGGAAGFELDRADTRLGTPDGTVVLASSEGHGDTFVLVPEEHLTHITTTTGDRPQELIRADMVFFETGKGGAVFSVGSITFCGSLPYNNFDNNISTLLGNVLDRFLDPSPDFGGSSATG